MTAAVTTAAGRRSRNVRAELRKLLRLIGATATGTAGVAEQTVELRGRRPVPGTAGTDRVRGAAGPLRNRRGRGGRGGRGREHRGLLRGRGRGGLLAVGAPAAGADGAQLGGGLGR
ncbi:hypothetical protein M271_28190 [Streptomyces rapamycinicus NRRL 5491]|nr:hypothetical protein M271_28190 [Streptomyces rapamycinicus NRRL 5491]